MLKRPMSNCLKESTLGARIRCTDFEGLRVAESRYAPGTNLGPHAHDFTYVSLVLRGGFEERVGHTAEVARSASVVVMPSGLVHAECFGPLGARSMTVTLKTLFMNEMSQLKRHFEPWRWFHAGEMARIMLGLYREHVLEGSLAAMGLYEMLVKLADAMGGECDAGVSRRRCVKAAIERLHERSVMGMRLGELALDLGTDPTYLARAFRRQMGCTMSEYRRRLWVREAAHLLASTVASLSDVALKAGFADQSHLCRVFKAEMGVTPQAYRVLAGSR